MNRNPTVYLAGPMRGYDRYNFDQFFEAEERLTKMGFTVMSPARHDCDMGFDPDRALDDQPAMKGGEFDIIQAFRWDVIQVIQTEATVLLPGWRASSGASLECEIAKFVGRLTYEFADDSLDELLEVGAPPPETVLEEAARIVDGDRMAVYGHPLDDFGATSEYWATYLRHKYGARVPLAAEDVGWMMTLLKISREGNMPKRDNKVDAAGYIRTVEKCEEEREARQDRTPLESS